MNAKQAYARARRRWGRDAIVTDGGAKRAGTPESRKAAADALAAIPRDKRHGDEVRRLRWAMRAKRYSVGHSALDGLFNMIEGQGDTWAEAFADADQRAERFKRSA